MATASEPSETRMTELERRLTERLEEIERAAAAGRLWELVSDVPSVDEQLQPFLDDSANRP